MESEPSIRTVKLAINAPVLAKWVNYQQLGPNDKEACGVLIGGYEIDEDCYVISDITTPLPNDVRSRASFRMQDKGHQEAVDRAFEISGGKQIYLGTWHTHPEATPQPSVTDLEDWKKCIVRNKERCLFFVIIGTGKFRVYSYSNENSEFVMLMTRSVNREFY